MIEHVGILGAFWFLALSGVGLIIGYRLGGQNAETIFGMEEGTAQITGHSSMMMALAVNAEFMHAYWDSLLAFLPQQGSDINLLTAAVVWGFTALIWVIAPVVLAVARSELHDRRVNTEGSADGRALANTDA
jgi:hypothetical protein